VLKYDFDNSVGYWVVTTSHALEQALNEELMRHGITVRQFQVLAWLSLEGDLSQAELAERMTIEAPTLVGILDRMERDGWISRLSCASDRRKKLIRPTERVQPVWSRMTSCARRVRARATRGIDPIQLEQLKQVLGSIRDNLRSPATVKETSDVS
jgi:MarR family transcriptional regulator for hemolysin